MSNVGRPREGMKPCPHCKSKDRDSNGQCRCRNVLYRLVKGLSKADAAKAKALYNEALTGPKSVDKATAALRAEFPAPERKARAAKKAAAKKTVAKKAAASEKRTAPKKEDTVKPEPERYLLVVDDFEETKYARKDAAIKAGVRGGGEWKVLYKGKVVAQSDDVL